MAVEKPLHAPVWAETGETVRPTDAEISEGWPLSATPPSRQRFNWILGWLAQNTAYLRQTGIPPWDAEESYPVDAVVIHNHGLWVAKRENTNVAPGTSPDDWAGAAELLAGSGDLVQKIVAGTGVTVSPVEGTGEVTISTTLDPDGVVQKIVAGTGVTVSPVEGTGEVTISATGGGSGGGVSKIIAGEGVTISPANGTGNVTISATGGGGGGGGVIPPSPGDHSLDAGFWRIIVGSGRTITGYMDTVTMPKPLGAVLAISVTEYNAVGWGPPGPNGEVTEPITVYGTTAHADGDKFYMSGASQMPGDVWKYRHGLGFQYIAIGENPDYVPPAPAP